MKKTRGFTLIELMVVMAIVATLVAIVAPRYFRHLDHTKEVALQQTLTVVRDAIDKYYADKGKYPATLEELVEQRYLRSLPVDPVSDSKETWELLPPPDAADGGVYDLHSSAPGSDAAGVAYHDY